MRSPAQARFHAAIFASTDPAATTTLLVGGTIADIQANVPPGGCWRQVPAGMHRAADVPALGALPAPVIWANDGHSQIMVLPGASSDE
jgi:hypothetical protein